MIILKVPLIKNYKWYLDFCINTTFLSHFILEKFYIYLYVLEEKLIYHWTKSSL